jgi:hypothetical protein
MLPSFRRCRSKISIALQLKVAGLEKDMQFHYFDFDQPSPEDHVGWVGMASLEILSRHNSNDRGDFLLSNSYDFRALQRGLA